MQLKPDAFHRSFAVLSFSLLDFYIDVPANSRNGQRLRDFLQHVQDGAEIAHLVVDDGDYNVIFHTNVEAW